MLHADLKDFLRRKIDKFGLCEQALIFLFAERKIRRRLWKFFAFQPRGIIGESIRCSAISILKRAANLLVFQSDYRGDQVFLQKIRGTSCDLNCKFHIGFGKHVIQVRFACDKDVWNLGFDRNQAANAIFKRCKIPFDINIHIGCARIDHRIALEGGHVLHLKEVLLDRRLQYSQIDGLARTQFARVELRQSIIEPP